MGTAFQGNKPIRAFSELSYFTSITSLPYNAFYNNDNLIKVKFPDRITSTGGRTFYDCSNLKYVDYGSGITSFGGLDHRYTSKMQAMIIRNPIPPSMSITNFFPYGTLYVPDDAVETYKTHATWSYFASRTKPISEAPSYDDF